MKRTDREFMFSLIVELERLAREAGLRDIAHYLRMAFRSITIDSEETNK
jgi:hypothetical protein